MVMHAAGQVCILNFPLILVVNPTAINASSALARADPSAWQTVKSKRKKNLASSVFEISRQEAKNGEHDLNHDIALLQQPGDGEATCGSVKARGTCIEDEWHTPREVPQL